MGKRQPKTRERARRDSPRIQDLRATRARLENENRDLRALLEVVPAGVCIADDPECTQLRMNGELARIFGLPEETNISLTPPRGESPPFVAEVEGKPISGDELPMQRAVRERRTIRDFRHDLVFGDGRKVALRVNAAPLFDDQGNVRGAIAACWDVTESVRSAEQLRVALEERLMLTRELQHRFKNRLATLLSLFDMRLARNGSRETQKALLDMRGRVAAMATLYEMFHGRAASALPRLDEYLRSVVSQLAIAHDAVGRGIQVAINAIPLQVHSDAAARVGLIVNELVVNALRHGFPAGRPGAIEVRMTIEREHDCLLVGVRDDGVGESATTTSGLGLELVESLAQSLDGDVARVPANGVWRQVTLPLSSIRSRETE